MPVDSWTPASKALLHIQSDDVDQLVAIDLNQRISSIKVIEPFAKAEPSVWIESAQHLPEDVLIHLIKLFTLIEKQENWDLAAKSPVIPLFKAYKQRSGINKELVHWVKSNTDNKFLPFGPLL